MNNVQPGRVRRLRIALAAWLVVFVSGASYAEKYVPRKLVAGSDLAYRPLSYLSDGLPTGFDRDFVDRMGELLRITVDFKLNQWTDTLGALGNGSVDFVTGCVETDSRDGDFDFTIPYLTDNYYIYANVESGIVGAGDLSGKRLVLLANDAILETWVRPAGLDSNLATVATLGEAFAKVNAGDADYTVAPFALGQTALQGGALKAVSRMERPLLPVEFRFAVRKGEGTLLAVLNDGISMMERNGDGAELSAKWKIPVPRPLFSSVLSKGVFLHVMIAVIVLFALGAAWYFMIYFGFRRHNERLRDDLKFYELLLGALPLGLRWESLDRSRHGENQLYRLFDQAERKKTVRRKLIEISSLMSDPVGRLVVLEDASRVQDLEARVKKLTRELTEKSADLVAQSIVDPVSGLFNRGFMKNKIIGLQEKYRSGNGSFSVIMVNWVREAPDPFEIRSFARRLKGCIGIHDFAGILDSCRYLVALPGLSGAEVSGMADRIESYMSEDADGGKPREITCVPYGCDPAEGRLDELLAAL